MHPETHANLEQALRGEAMAALKYWLFERRAETAGLDDVAELFERIGKEERKQHAREIAALLDIPGPTRENLQAAIDGEVAEHRRLYPRFASLARIVGDIEAAERFQELGADEHRHADELRGALEALGETGAEELGDVAPSSERPRDIDRTKEALASAAATTAAVNVVELPHAR
jgi:rubrerythrin